MPKRKLKLYWKVIITLLIILIIGTLIAFFANSRDKSIIVTTSIVDERTITQTVSAVGKIQPETEVKVSSETSGEIIFLGPKEGDTVRKGQLIVRIKPDIIESQLEQYKAAADAARMQIDYSKAEKDRAQSDLQRMTELYEKEFISKQEYERAKAIFEQSLSSYRTALSRYDQAIALLKQFQRSADRTTIFAPISGIITKLDVEVGEKVVGTEMMQGTEMMRISDLDVMNAVVDVDENDIVLVKIGDTANIEIDAFPDRIFKGKVVELGHSAKVNLLGTQDQATNFEVKIRIIENEPKLRPGMSCNVEILTETKYNVLAVPLQSVTVRESDKNKQPDVSNEGWGTSKVYNEKSNVKKPQSVVFLNRNGKAKKVDVETGISDKGFIEITSGLKKGDEIISGNFSAISKELYDGAVIKIENKKYKIPKKQHRKDENKG